MDFTPVQRRFTNFKDDLDQEYLKSGVDYQAGEIVYGLQIGPGNDPPETVKALKEFGFDFIIIENEHSLVNKETIYEYVKETKEV